MQPLKYPKTYKEQIDLLKSRKLQIDDNMRAEDILSHVNYYRLINAYSLDLYDTSPSVIPKTIYRPGVSLEQIYDIYQFDMKLRHILFELIEYFELVFRTRLAYYMAQHYCATAYLRKELHYNEERYHEFLAALEREKSAQQRSPIVLHHTEYYDGVLPVWAMVEIVTFGTLSKLFKNLVFEAQRGIAASHGTNPLLFSSHLNSFVSVRNVCAHYGRIYNTNLSARPMLPKHGPRLNEYKIFSTIYLLYGYIEEPLLKLSLYYRLRGAIVQHSSIELEKIGFPQDWEPLLRERIGLPAEDIAGSDSETE